MNTGTQGIIDLLIDQVLLETAKDFQKQANLLYAAGQTEDSAKYNVATDLLLNYMKTRKGTE